MTERNTSTFAARVQRWALLSVVLVSVLVLHGCENETQTRADEASDLSADVLLDLASDTGISAPQDAVDTSPDAVSDPSPGDGLDTAVVDTTGLDADSASEPPLDVLDSIDAVDSAGGSGPADSSIILPEMGLEMALLGDQGVTADARAALQLVLVEGADFLVIVGDFDYNDDPPSWAAMLDEELGDFPVFAIGGNHDLPMWTDYQAIIAGREAAIAGADCLGTVGEDHACTYRGVHLVLSGVGVFAGDHSAYLRSQLGPSRYAWRLCGWHKNQQDMQLGGKSNEAGWEAYQICQELGGFIMTGHEHSYSRTYTLTDVGNEANGHGAVGVWDEMHLALGSTYVMVDGAGGRPLRDYEPANHDDDTWWAAGHASNMNIVDGARTPATNTAPGVIFIEFGLGGDPLAAQGTFKTTDGSYSDAWTITVDPTGFGQGAVVDPGWDAALCADFCAKCADCYATDAGFSEGDCHYQTATGTFDSTDCADGCAVAQTPAFDPATLPAGWQTLTCADFDAGM